MRLRATLVAERAPAAALMAERAPAATLVAARAPAGAVCGNKSYLLRDKNV